jgi:PAS domain-containing protein
MIPAMQSWIGVNLDIQEHKLAEFSGSTPPSIREYMALVHPDDREFVAQEIKTMLAEHRGFDFTKRIVRPDGSVRHVRGVGTPVTNGGMFQGFVGTEIDVTEHEELITALRKSEAELRQMLDFAPQLVGVYGPNRERLHINRVGLEYLGRSLEEWRQTPESGAFVHPDDRGQEQEYLDRAVSTGSAYELELRLRKGDGSYRCFWLGTSRCSTIRGTLSAGMLRVPISKTANAPNKGCNRKTPLSVMKSTRLSCSRRSLELPPL